MEINKFSITSRKLNVNFSIKKLTENDGQRISSPEFEIDLDNYRKSKWVLDFYPRGRKFIGKSISLLLRSLNHSEVKLIWSFSILNKFGDKWMTRDSEHSFSESEEVWGFNCFVDRTSLFEFLRSQNQDEDERVLQILLEFDTNVDFVISNNQRQASIFQNEFLEEVLDQKMFTDFVIGVGDREIAAHKLILAARSPKLHNLFKSDPNLNRLVIGNFEYNVIEQLINFMYKNRVENIENLHPKLSQAAIEFAMKDLFQLCENFTTLDVTLDNVLDKLKIAFNCNYDKLKEICLEIIERNFEELSKSEKWTQFLHGNSNVIKLWIVEYQEKLPIFIPFHETHQKNVESKICNDFENLFLSEKFSDVTFEVLGRSLKAHKNILSSRSTVFDAMFTHDTLEAERNVIQIEDISYEVLQELLRFIYCGRASNLEQVAIDLLPAADKYGFLDLKTICEVYLRENLNTQGALEVLCVADFHNCLELKLETMHFVGKNISLIVQTLDWTDFFESHRNLFNEMLLKWINMKMQ